jgi:hypothetical protein
MTNTTAAPAPTTRARRIVRELSTMGNLSYWHFTFAAEGDQVVARPASDACLCTYAFPRTWGVVRINTFLMERVNYGE